MTIFARFKPKNSSGKCKSDETLCQDLPENEISKSVLVSQQTLCAATAADQIVSSQDLSPASSDRKPSSDSISAPPCDNASPASLTRPSSSQVSSQSAISITESTPPIVHLPVTLESAGRTASQQTFIRKASLKPSDFPTTLPCDLESRDLTTDDGKLQVALLLGLGILAKKDTAEILPNFIRDVKTSIKEESVRASAKCWVNGVAKKLTVKVYHTNKFAAIFSSEDYVAMMAKFGKGFEKTGAGKSGSDMYWSRDRQYIAKTLSPIEVSQGRSLFPALCDYTREEPGTFLVKYAALIRVGLPSGRKVFLAVMPNVLFGFAAVTHFDLKGSLHKREAANTNEIQKDKDFINVKQRLAFASPVKAEAFHAQLEKDAGFLAKHIRIDYSLLVGIAVDGSWRGGIIDILTPYTARKKIEFAAKGSVHGYDRISCVPPHKYAGRFVRFVADAS